MSDLQATASASETRSHDKMGGYNEVLPAPLVTAGELDDLVRRSS